eukprot:COSAG02_NODE_1344_length_13159_cov_10.788208_10_plen_204_part_00
MVGVIAHAVRVRWRLQALQFSYHSCLLAKLCQWRLRHGVTTQPLLFRTHRHQLSRPPRHSENLAISPLPRWTRRCRPPRCRLPVSWLVVATFAPRPSPPPPSATARRSPGAAAAVCFLTGCRCRCKIRAARPCRSQTPLSAPPLDCRRRRSAPMERTCSVQRFSLVVQSIGARGGVVGGKHESSVGQGQIPGVAPYRGGPRLT